jgi:hypothetical protein
MCTSNLKVISLQMGLPVVCKSNYHTITAMTSCPLFQMEIRFLINKVGLQETGWNKMSVYICISI